MATDSAVEADRTIDALRRTDRCCRLIVRELRESHPSILEGPELEALMKQTRRQFRENRELLGIEAPSKPSGAQQKRARR